MLKLFRIFQGCFTVQLSRFFIISNFCILSQVQNFVNYFFIFFVDQRRRRDLNPRAAINDLHPFQGCPFSLLGTSPDWFLNFIQLTERVGFEPTRPCGQTVFKTASLWPLRYLSICLFAFLHFKRQELFYHRLFHLSTTFFIFFDFLSFT